MYIHITHNSARNLVCVRERERERTFLSFVLKTSNHDLFTFWCAGQTKKGCYFLAYEAAKRWLTPKGGRVEELGTLGLLTAGGCGGLGVWLVVFPIDTIKSRIQTDTVGRYERGAKGILQVLREASRQPAGLVRGLYKGFAPCLLRSFPANAACLCAYELTLRALSSLPSDQPGLPTTTTTALSTTTITVTQAESR